MSSVEIIVGHRWKDDVRYIDSLQGRRPADSGLDLLELRDIIDIVVDGANLTASIPEEAIFGLVGNLLASLVELIDETSRKAIVEFHHEPWELVLVPDGSMLQLSLYSIDRRRRVVVRDQAIDARAFIDAICEVAEQMLTDLLGVSERYSSDPQVRRISQALARLKRTPRVNFPPRNGQQIDGAGGPRLASTSTSDGLTLSFRFDGADAGLRSYRGEHVFDLHSLLFDGALQAEFGSQALVLAHQFPFLAITGLLHRTRQLFNQLESHANDPFVLDEPLPRLGFSVEGEGSHWLLRAEDAEHHTWHQCEVHPSDCLDALVSLAELFAQDMTRANPHLTVNQRYLDFEEEVQKLRRWHRDLCGNNLYHERPEDYLQRLGHLEPASAPAADPPDFPWPLSTVHTLFPHRSWTLRAGRIDFGSIALTPSSLLLATPGSIRCLTPQNGREQWRHEFDTDTAHDGAIVVTGDHLISAAEGGVLHLLDRHGGELITTVDTGQEDRTLVGAACYESQDLTVAARRSGEVCAFDPRTGAVQWRTSTAPSELRQILFHGPLICVQSAEGVVSALNPASGETLWKIRTGGTSDRAVTIHQGRIYAVTHDPLHRGSTLYALYPFTGRTIWQLRLNGYACGPPSFVDHWMVLPVERRGQLTLVGIDLEAVDPRANWDLELSSAGVDRPTQISPVVLDGDWHGLVRTDRAELTCFCLADGEVRWRVIPATETLLLHGNLPLFQIRDAVINISERVDLRDVYTGRMLHTFDAIEAPEFGFLAPPFSLLFGEQAPGGEAADQLTAYSVDHFLALVD